MSVESRPAADASIGELMSQLSAQASRLVRDEMRLAQKELQQSAKHAGIGAGLISAAGLMAVCGLATLIAAGVAALALVLPVVEKAHAVQHATIDDGRAKVRVPVAAVVVVGTATLVWFFWRRR